MRVYKVRATNGNEYVAKGEYTFEAERSVQDTLPDGIYVRSTEPVPDNYVVQIKYVYVDCPRACCARSAETAEARKGVEK